jgi:hypothetical protein
MLEASRSVGSNADLRMSESGVGLNDQVYLVDVTVDARAAEEKVLPMCKDE